MTMSSLTLLCWMVQPVLSASRGTAQRLSSSQDSPSQGSSEWVQDDRPQRSSTSTSSTDGELPNEEKHDGWSAHPDCDIGEACKGGYVDDNIDKFIMASGRLNKWKCKRCKELHLDNLKLWPIQADKQPRERVRGAQWIQSIAEEITAKQAKYTHDKPADIESDEDTNQRRANSCWKWFCCYQRLAKVPETCTSKGICGGKGFVPDADDSKKDLPCPMCRLEDCKTAIEKGGMLHPDVRRFLKAVEDFHQRKNEGPYPCEECLGRCFCQTARCTAWLCCFGWLGDLIAPEIGCCPEPEDPRKWR